ncbi:Vi polysaccharide biosynthesis UDP-N-acetylglucosamine C-6 dehydrogenase TviB [Gammaproteobacteria bacterium]|nr:Vi polysaccharide biosynthesis UDP-N-acetylglucosamine C-6 dehydrogenase TviB [Gammaproteobacteria bacterium]
MADQEINLGIVGLGYVGLPLAVEFAKIRSVMGFDIKSSRIDELRLGIDKTLEVEPQEFEDAKHIQFTANIDDLKECNCFIITVPTPITADKKPDLTPLLAASKTIGSILKKGDIVIYESTVYPGATEDECVPVLENQSGLLFNSDFFVGYSPERINPGDRDHRLPSIIKITSGSTPSIAKTIDKLYKSIIKAGTHQASSIKVAEAAKVIENTQRDLNIALINEFALIFNKLNIDTEEVLLASGTKWNFLPFRPGLVGGHCIGVDPYYLTHKAQSIGYEPEIILSGRNLNDSMSSYIINNLFDEMHNRNLEIKSSNILVMGLSFKENCPDFRNSKIIDLISGLSAKEVIVDCYDPWVNKSQAKDELSIELIDFPKKNKYSAIIIAVAHLEFLEMSPDDIRSLGNEKVIIYDLKYVLPQSFSDLRL